jgi:hypothetical protein
MDATPTDIALIAHSIQLSVAPVFLLSGVGVLLGVLTNRLARVVDRARARRGATPPPKAPRPTNCAASCSCTRGARDS